jgi:hypothetical protein
MGDSVQVIKIPQCDLCNANGVTKEAYADARIVVCSPYQIGLRPGMWANVCEPHFKTHKCTLGTGCGQRYVRKV